AWRRGVLKPTDLQQGVLIGERLLPWGTTLAEADSLLGALPPPSSCPSMPIGDRWLPCDSAYGVPVVTAQLTAPAPDRPVMSVSFELAPQAAPPDPERWASPLSQQLGAPEHFKNEEPPSYAA